MVTLLEFTIEALLFGLLVLEEIMLLLKIILVLEKASIVCLDLGLGLLRVGRNELLILGHLGQWQTILSPVENSLPGHILLGVLKDTCRWHLIVIAVQLFTVGRPQEIIKLRLGGVLPKLRDALLIRLNVIVHHLNFGFLILSQHWKMLLVLV
jgi:hypothetical protein